MPLGSRMQDVILGLLMVGIPIGGFLGLILLGKLLG